MIFLLLNLLQVVMIFKRNVISTKGRNLPWKLLNSKREDFPYFEMTS